MGIVPPACPRYGQKAMHTRQDLARILGLSYKQVRTRLAHLAREGNLLQGQVVKGRNGRLEYTPAVIDLLRDLAPLAQGPGKDNGQAARELAKKIHGNGDKSGQGQAGNPVNLTGNPEALEVEVRYLKQAVDDLRRERDSWKELALSLQGQLALPSPKWWWWPFGR